MMHGIRELTFPAAFLLLSAFCEEYSAKEVQPKGFGEPCDNNEECDAGLCCVLYDFWEGSVCSVLGHLHESCSRLTMDELPQVAVPYCRKLSERSSFYTSPYLRYCDCRSEYNCIIDPSPQPRPRPSKYSPENEEERLQEDMFNKIPLGRCSLRE